MAELSSEEREATDQPPPINAPFTPRQWRGLLVPALVFLGLLAVLLWGLLSTMRPQSATGAPPVVPSRPPAGAAAAPSPPASPTAPPLAAAVPPTASPTAPPPAAPSATPAGAPDSPTAAPTLPLTPPGAPSPSVVAQAQSETPTPDPRSPIPDPRQIHDPRSPLQGRRIGLDPGHGPRGDLGAVLVDPDTGKLILAESDLNLDVGLRLAAILRARGAQVVLTRETADSFTAPWPPDTNGDGIKGGQSDDLQERIDILNAFHAEVFLSIHANSSANPAKRQGIQVLYCAEADCAFPTQERHLGALVIAELRAKLDAAGDPVQASELRNDFWSDTPGEPPGHLFLLGPASPPQHVRAAQMPGVIAESLYITSPQEAAQLKQDNVRQAIALAYADALQQYLTGQGP